jgi:hypothetical protein
MEAARTSEKLVNFYQTTWRYNPADSHLRISSLFGTVLSLSRYIAACQFETGHDGLLPVSYQLTIHDRLPASFEAIKHHSRLKQRC